jgi:quinoprotein glucose dehydrogenase
MSSTNASSTPVRRHWLPLVCSAVILLLGLALAAGGAWLAVLGGAWYYAIAGVAMIVSALLMMRGLRVGAWLYGAVIALTLAWTAWESGLDYWRWVPRLGLVLALGIPVALAMQHLHPRVSRKLSRLAAGVCALGVAIGVGFAFVPHGVTHNGSPRPASQPLSTPATSGADAGVSTAHSPAPGDWTAYGRDNGSTRYVRSAQINRDNVARLQRVWTYRTGDTPQNRWGAQTTSLKVGDTLYLCSARNILIALDAGTGEERWRYDPEVSDDYIPYTAACRSVSYFDRTAPIAGANAGGDSSAPAQDDAQPLQDAVPAAPSPSPSPAPVAAGAACATRIIEGTLDARLIAVDARTGVPCQDFGDNGQVSITQGMGDVAPGMVSMTSPPTIVRGVVVTGHQVLDGQRRFAPSGVIQGFDAVTGELRWAWDMVRPEWNGLPPEGEVFTEGTPNMWTIASGDDALGYVFLPMANSSADYWSSSRRPAEIEYATSLVALDVTTGKPAWHFQTVRIDVWDYDLGSQGTLVDFPTANGPVPALVLPSKQGDIYVLDRRTGKPLTPVGEMPAPGGGVEPEMRSPTQPFSRYHTLRKPDLTERDMWGMTPIDQLVCRIQFRRASYKGIYTPPTSDTRWVQYPGYNGGSDWGGIAIDPDRGVILANYNDMPNYNRLVPRAEVERKGWEPRDVSGEVGEGGPEGAGDPQAGTPYGIDVNAGWRLPFTKLLCKQPPYGGIRAIDLASGKTLWDRPFGTARKNGPFKIPSYLPITIGTPNNGGPAVTAGGIAFIAAATDDLIRAIDMDTGETIWKDALPAGAQATPTVYEVDGRQFMVIMAGGHHFMETPPGDYVIAYALPEGGEPEAGSR